MMPVSVKNFNHFLESCVKSNAEFTMRRGAARRGWTPLAHSAEEMPFLMFSNVSITVELNLSRSKNSKKSHV